MTYDDEDLKSYKLVIWREARGEQQVGMRAVGHVIKNRVGASTFPSTLHDVIYQKNAFTSMSVSSDAQYNLEPKTGDPQYAYITSVAEQILNDQDEDLTNSAKYYADLKYVTSGWFHRAIVNDPINHPQVAVIGRHTFYL